MIKQKLVYNDLSVDSFIKKANGLCPLMPEEVYAIILKVNGKNRSLLLQKDTP